MVRAFVLSLALSAACLAPAQGQTPTPPASGYFPDALLRGGDCGPAMIAFEDEWYSRILRGAGEPSLLPLTRSPTAGQVVRFLYLPSFSEQIVIRVNVPATGPIAVTAKKVAWDRTQNGFRTTGYVARTLSASESAGLRDLLARTQLSQIPAKDCPTPLGKDGETWIIESVEAGRYHYVNRWVPPKGEVLTLGTELARLVGWQRAVGGE